MAKFLSMWTEKQVSVPKKLVVLILLISIIYTMGIKWWNLNLII